jgi:4-amino-4-deoxy-L-arabinose transferase-like glycosyltransferase
VPVAVKRPALLLAAVIGFAALVRGPFWIEALRTPVDGDTAIIGLMARHPLRATTMWGQPYGSPVEAWLAWPLFALFGATASTLRAAYFALGLLLVPAAWALARALDPRAALPAAVLLACPSPYLLLMAAMPPPMYPSALALSALALAIALAAVARGRPSAAALLGWGIASGLALWTHLMTAPAVAASAAYLASGTRNRRRLWIATAALVAACAPWWMRAAADPQAGAAVSVSGRRASFGDHVSATLPALHRPLGGLLGTHTPLVADDPDHLVRRSTIASVALLALWALGLALAARGAREHRPTWPLLAVIAAALVAFPFPLRSGPSTIRFLTPIFVPLAALLAWGAVTRLRPRTAWSLVLAIAALDLAGGARLLAAWRGADRAAPPFALPDLGPVRAALEASGVRRAYASYGPAYRLTFESGERLVVSQPWNERFLHHPLPYLDEVRFAHDVAWVLTPEVPSDLPPPAAFEEALTRAGGTWARERAGAAVVYARFVPPFPPHVRPLPSAHEAGDGDPETAMAPEPGAAVRFEVVPKQALSAVTLVAAGHGPPLLRSMDVEVSADGSAFERVASRRRRGERDDLRWVNGHPQYVIDNDVLSVPLGGRTVAAFRIVPVATTDAWSLAEVLLHPAGAPPAWAEWLAPDLGWPERRAALDREPHRDRVDWYSRWLMARRRRD